MKKNINEVVVWDEAVVINPRIEVNKINVMGETVLVLDNVLTEESYRTVGELSDKVTKSKYGVDPDNLNSHIDARFTGTDMPARLRDLIILCIREHLGMEVSPNTSNFSINYFMSKQGGEAFIGGSPHIDSEQGYASLLYLNKNKIAGTSFYRTHGGTCRIFDRRQAVKGLFMGGYLFTEEDFIQNFSGREVIEGIPNRLIIYPGNFIHGACHTNKEHTSEYRKTLVSFFELLLEYKN
jgi:hypothetical protein